MALVGYTITMMIAINVTTRSIIMLHVIENTRFMTDVL